MIYTLVALALLMVPAVMISDSAIETVGQIKERYDSGKLVSDSVLVKVRPPKIPQVTVSASPLSIGFQDCPNPGHIIGAFAASTHG